MTIGGTTRYLIAVQMLRAIAAIMVVFVHIDTELVRLHYKTLGCGWLSDGVDIFFVTSGFIMWTSIERRRGLSATEFLKNRIIRIVPLYWFMTLVVVAVALVAPHALGTTKLQPLHAFASFLFLPVRHPTAGLFWPLLIPGWSLNYEMLFYAVLALALALSRKRSVRFALVSTGILGILVAGKAFQSLIDVGYFYANPVMIEFVVGMALGAFWRTGRVQPNYAFFIVSIAGFIVLWPGSNLHWLPVTYVGSTMVVGGAIFLPSLPENPLSRLGDASYSLYLTHTVVLSALAFAWQALAPRTSFEVFVVTSIACAIGAAFAMHSYFERPVSALLKKTFPNRPGAHCSEGSNVDLSVIAGPLMPPSP